jgi:hypothetical protein
MSTPTQATRLQTFRFLVSRVGGSPAYRAPPRPGIAWRVRAARRLRAAEVRAHRRRRARSYAPRRSAWRLSISVEGAPPSCPTSVDCHARWSTLGSARRTHVRRHPCGGPARQGHLRIEVGITSATTASVSRVPSSRYLEKFFTGSSTGLAQQVRLGPSASRSGTQWRARKGTITNVNDSDQSDWQHVHRSSCRPPPGGG